MSRIVSLSALVGMLALALTTGMAQAEPREFQRCKIVKKCEWHHGHRICKKFEVCKPRH